MTPWNPTDTPSFLRQEMACTCGTCNGRSDMDGGFMAKLQAMRDRFGPITITSGFRCPQHPEEFKKAHPGAHAQGHAADIRVWDSRRRYDIIRIAFECGMVGIGISSRFVHVDDAHAHMPRPAVWTY